MSISRRRFLVGSAAVVAAHQLAACRAEQPARTPTWNRAAYRKTARPRVAVLPAASYDASLLTDVVRRGIEAFALPVSGKRVVLKPNMVELERGGVINTNPALILAAVEAFRSLGAREVIVAEGPGHRRDNQYLLVASGV